MAERSPTQRIWYRFMRMLCRLTAVVMFRLRIEGGQHEPCEGGVLVVSNHQSHLDPVLVGVACRRQLNFLARETLFDFAPLGWLIRSLGGVPINREGSGLSGLKETLKRLKRQEMVLVFPEGTRSADGQLRPLKPGFCTLARRGKVAVLPVAVTGAYQAWPRRRRFPRPGRVQLRFGPVITDTEVQALTDDELVIKVERRISDLLEAG